MGIPSTNMAGAIASVEKALAAKPKRRAMDLGRLKRTIEEPLREAYLSGVVRRIADELAADFIAHKFDDAYNVPDEHRFLVLEKIVHDMPICMKSDSAQIVLLVSEHSAEAFQQVSEATPEGGDWLLRALAANCLAEDLCKEAFRRGWHRSHLPGGKR
jgi:hypothetical protein